MEGFGFCLFLLLMYLLSGYKKKQQQAKKRKEIESEDGWDTDDIPFSPQIQKWFEKQGWLEEDSQSSLSNDEPHQEKVDVEREEVVVQNDLKEVEEIDHNVSLSNLSEIDHLEKEFEKQIYHSKLADRDVLKIKKKQKSLFVNQLMSNRQQLMQSFIIKEVLDRPRAFRKAIR